jgi:hypothetical protein
MAIPRSYKVVQAVDSNSYPFHTTRTYNVKIYSNTAQSRFDPTYPPPAAYTITYIMPYSNPSQLLTQKYLVLQLLHTKRE